MNRRLLHRLLAPGPILVLALVVRVAWAIAVPVVPVSDSAAYDTMATNIASGHGMCFEPGTPTAYWPVGTPAFYAGVYRVFGHRHEPIVALNILMQIATIAMSMALARRWFGAPAGTWTGLCLALWPMHVQFVTILASEIPFTMLAVGAVLAWERLGPRVVARGLGVGALLALATYVRTTALLLPAGLAAGDLARNLWAARGAARWRPALSAGIAFVVIAAALAPWTHRNYRRFGELVLVSTNAGSTLWMGNRPAGDGEYALPPEMPGLNEAQWNKELGRIAKQEIRARPAAFITRTAIKAVRMHDRETHGVVWNEKGLERRGASPSAVTAIKGASSAYWYAVLAGTGIGLVMLARTRGVWAALTHPVVVVWAYFTALHAIMLISDRYHYPPTPLLATLAGLAASRIIGRFAAREVSA